MKNINTFINEARQKASILDLKDALKKTPAQVNKEIKAEIKAW